MSGYTNSSGDIGPPTGSIIAFAGGTAPNGWLMCNGGGYSTSTYSKLYGVILNHYGGDGNTFYVPNLTNKFIRGKASMPSLGNVTGGADSVTLATANLPSHNHSASDSGHSHTASQTAHNHTASDSGHTHRINQTNNGALNYDGGSSKVFTNGNNDGNEYSNTGYANISISSVTPTITVNTGYASVSVGYTGSGTAFNIIPTYMGLNYIIKY